MTGWEHLIVNSCFLLDAAALRQHRRFILGTMWSFALILMVTAPGLGQETETKPDPKEATQDLAASDQTVEVESPVRDAEIESRLQRILESTERFENPRVRVDNGVVFLEGTTPQVEHRVWASDLARKTQDVVAVVNRIEVEESPLWDLGPAFAELQDLWRQVIRALPLFGAGLLVLGLTVLLSRSAAGILTSFFTRRTDSEILKGVIRKIIIVVIVLLGIYLFLRISGLTRIAVSVIGGTGVAGLILGFAFRDIAENFLASILISIQRPFQIQDTIEVEGHLGIVQKVTTRGTILMDFDGNFIQLANSTVYKNTIKNFTANPKIRSDFAVGIGYDASITEAQSIAQKVINEHPAVLHEPEPLVLVEQFGASTINLRIYFWIDGQEFSVLKVKSAVMRLTLRALDEAGISLPDEAREVVFPEPVPVRMLDAESSVSPSGAKASDEVSVQKKRAPQESGAHANEAEGDLGSEVKELESQARQSRTLEAGADILQSSG